MFLFAVEKRTNRFSRSQFFDSRTVTFDFGIRRARSETDLFGEDVEDAGETDERRVLGNGARRKVTEDPVLREPQIRHETQMA